MKTIALLTALIASTSSVAGSAQPAGLIRSQTSQAPGYYRVHLGRFTVTVLTDGVTSVPYDKLLRGKPMQEIVRAFAAIFYTPEGPT